MVTMVCPAWFERISAAVDGELADDALGAVEDHCRTCPSCASSRRRLEDIRRRSLLRVPHQAPDLAAAVLAGEGASQLRSRGRRRRVLAVAAALAIANPLGGSASTPADQAGPPVPVTGVTIKTVDDAFDNGDLNVARGTTIRWENDGRHTHRLVRHLGGELVASDLAPGGTEAVTFNDAGDYDYFCSIHRGMSGRILVSS